MSPAELARIIFALSTVLLLLSFFAYAAKKFDLGGFAGLASKKRLRLVETLTIDAKLKAAIISCDGAEHLVVINPSSVTVIARDIAPATATASSPAPSAPAAAADAPRRAARETEEAAPLFRLSSFPMTSAAALNPFARSSRSVLATTHANERPEAAKTPQDLLGADVVETVQAEEIGDEIPADETTRPIDRLLNARETFLAAYRRVA